MPQYTQEVTIATEEQVVIWHYSGGFFAERSMMTPRNGRSLEELAREVAKFPKAYAFQIEIVAKATAVIEDTPTQLLSKPYVTSMTYVGGRIYTLDALRAWYPEKITLYENIQARGPNARAIHTRAGNWCDFKGEDTFLEEPK